MVVYKSKTSSEERKRLQRDTVYVIHWIDKNSTNQNEWCHYISCHGNAMTNAWESKEPIINDAQTAIDLKYRIWATIKVVYKEPTKSKLSIELNILPER